jgi:hypothetical protein
MLTLLIQCIGVRVFGNEDRSFIYVRLSLEFLGTKIDRLYICYYPGTKIEHLDSTYVFVIKIERLYTYGKSFR